MHLLLVLVVVNDEKQIVRIQGDECIKPRTLFSSISSKRFFLSFLQLKKKNRQIAFNVPWTNREVARDTIKTSDFSKKTSSGLEGTLG